MGFAIIIGSLAVGPRYFTERNGTVENTEQLYKSLLQCLIFTKCWSWLLMELDKSYMLIPILRNVNFRVKVMAIGKLPPVQFQSQFFAAASTPANRVPACRAHWALASDIQYVDIRHFSEDLHSCSVSSKCSVPFCEIAMASSGHLVTGIQFLDSPRIFKVGNTASTKSRNFSMNN